MTAPAPAGIQPDAQRASEPRLAIRTLIPPRATRLPIVLLHGWGCDSSIWDKIAPLLAQQHSLLLVDLPGFGDSLDFEPGISADWIVTLLAEQLPQRFHLLGWSLGGMLATAFAATHQNRVASLCCLATNLCFSAGENWRCGMQRATFARFKEGFAASPATTLKRFRALQAVGDSSERQVFKSLGELSSNPTDPAAWSAALELLGELDNRDAAGQLQMPCLYLFGEKDQLVPVDTAAAIAENTAINVAVIPAQAHAPHLSDPKGLAQRLLPFFQRGEPEQTPLLDKKSIARSFGRAAVTYDSAAHLQRAIGNELMQRIGNPAFKATPTVVDMGCGTGHFIELLENRHSGGTLLGVDLAEGMVRYARRERPEAIHWNCGDAEQMPLADASVDLFFSNLAMQWCERLDSVSSELARILNDGGRALISTLGPATLHEMRTAWSRVDGFVHVNWFVPADQVEARLAAAGFSRVKVTTETRVVYYPTALALSRELKALGAHNVNTGRPRGMTGRQHLQQFADAYETFRLPPDAPEHAGLLPATWEVVYCELEK